jgi:DNA polymerase III sliding clamp (beta) subunit (PCNA family)
MKFKSSVLELQRNLKLLTPVVNYNHPILAFRYIKIFVNNGRLEIKGFDQSFVASVFPEYSDIQDDKIYGNVLAKQFIGLINSFKSEEVLVTIKDSICHIKSGRSNYKLPLLDDHVFQESIGELDFDYYSIAFLKPPIKVNSFVTKAMAVMHCLSKDDYRANLQYIYVKDGRMIACDGNKGAVIDFENEGLDGYLVHRKIINCIENISNTNEMFITLCEDKLYVKTKNFLFCSAVADIEYPYETVKEFISNGFADKIHSIRLSAEELIDKLGRVLMFADNDTNTVKVFFNEQEISLIVENNSYAEETISHLGQAFKSPFGLYVDGKNLRELLGKTTAEPYWNTDGEEEIQYLFDGELLQFFLGLSK